MYKEFNKIFCCCKADKSAGEEMLLVVAVEAKAVVAGPFDADADVEAELKADSDEDID